MKRLLCLTLLLFIVSAGKSQYRHSGHDYSVSVTTGAILNWGGHYNIDYKPVPMDQKKLWRFSPEVSFSIHTQDDAIYSIGLRYFSRTIQYEPYFYLNQTIRICHETINLPLTMALPITDKYSKLGHYALIGLSPGFLISSKNQLRLNDEIVEEGEHLIFEPKDKIIVDFLLGYQAIYELNDTFKISPKIQFGTSTGQVVHFSNRTVTYRYFSFDLSLSYSL